MRSEVPIAQETVFFKTGHFWETQMTRGKDFTGDSYYGEIAENYYKKRRSSVDFVAENEILEGLLAGIPDQSRVLDVPFGTGRFVEYYARKKMDVVGLEISGDMIGAAKEILGDKYNYCEILQGDATETLPFDNDSVDVIVSFRFLKYFPYVTAKEILSEFRRVTRSTLIIRMVVRRDHEHEQHLSDDYLSRLHKIKGNLYEKDVIKLFNDVGFEVESSHSVNELAKTMKVARVNLRPQEKRTLRTLRRLAGIRLGVIYKHLRNGSLLAAISGVVRKKKEARMVYQLRKAVD